MEHLRLLEIVNYFAAALVGLAGLSGGAVLIAMGVWTAATDGGDPEPMLASGLAVLLVLGLLAVIHLVAARRVREARWRIPQTILALLHLASFPLGTAYGGYALWVCWFHEESRARFA